MLTRDTIQDIVECRLPQQAIVEHLEALTSEHLDAQLIRTFVEVLGDSLDADAKQLCNYGGTIDPSGTGGSGLPHFNTSTTVAFVLAAGDLKVAKFGNRAAQSKSGSFDLLDAIGVPTNVPPSAVPELLETVGLAFLFAPHYYPGLAKLAPIRKSMGKRTVFNSIGPLLNPMRPSYRVMGVSCERAQRAVGDYLATDKANRRSLIVRSKSGYDELEPYADNVVVDAMPGYVSVNELNNLPETRSFDASVQVRHGGLECSEEVVAARAQYECNAYTFTPAENYKLFEAVVNNEGPAWLTDLVCLNAAAGMVANCCSSIEACYDIARELIASGLVAKKVDECRSAYARFST